MDLSAEQRDALSRCEAILTGVGLSPRVLDTSPSPSRASSRASTPSTPSSYISSFDCPPCPAVLASQYIPPPARLFTREERDCHANRVTRRTYVDGIIEHPLDAIVEYPQTGSRDGESIAHIFTVDPLNFFHPKSSFQYSLGDTHGGQADIKCHLLRDESGNTPVLCNKVRLSCEYHMREHNIC